MQYRRATSLDVAKLARLNEQLIRDEGHRNRMSLKELEERMALWLGTGYQAVLFEQSENTVGYVLYREETEHVYIRHFFILRENRRCGIGRAALQWLLTNVWSGARRLRAEVLVDNQDGIAFWRAVGFADYCLTMEMDVSPP